MTRFLLASSAILLSTLFALSFGASSVSAASPWDDLQINGVFEVSDGQTTHDIATDFFQIVDEHGSASCNPGGVHFESYQDAINTGAWAFYQRVYSSGLKTITLEWHETDKDAVDFQNIGGHYFYGSYGTMPNPGGGAFGFITVAFYPTNVVPGQWSVACNSLPTTSAGTRVFSSLSSDPTDVRLILSTYDVTYPEGYEGDTIPNDYTPGAEIVRPRFTYDVVDRNVTATHMPRASALPTYPNDPYSIEWFVHKCTDWDDNDNSCDNYDDTKLHYEITPSGGTTTFTVPDYGHYKISAGYLVGGCHRYPSWPATPDYCYYTAPENTDDYEYTTTAMMWNIDGTSFSGDTADDSLICDVSGFCEPPPFNCADVYSNNFVLRLSCSMQQDMNFGIVNPSLFAIKDLMQSMTVPDNPQCSIPLSNVSLFSGYTFPLATYSSVACAKAAELRTALPIVAVFINFLLAMLSIWMVVRIINKLFDHNDHNIIEGV